MSIDLVVNDITYEDGFTDIKVTRSFTNLCGQFNFTAVSVNSTLKDFPIKINDRCKVLVNNQPVLTGYIEKITINYTSDMHVISVEGRSRTCDLVDSTVDSTVIYLPPITLKEVINRVFKVLGITNIKVIEKYVPTPFTLSDIQSAQIGTSFFSFLEQLAKVKQVILTTDGDGNIVIDQASKSAIKTYLLNQLNNPDGTNNILSGSITYDYTNRFNFYRVYSQGNPVAFLQLFKEYQNEKDMIVDTYGNPAVDNEMRPSRRYNFVNEKSLTTDDLSKRARWEANIRRAASKIYSCKVQGFEADADGFLWAPNLLVNVVDEFADVNSQLLITDVTYSYSVSGGSITDLSMVVPDGFTNQVEQDAADARVSVFGKGYIIKG